MSFLVKSASHPIYRHTGTVVTVSLSKGTVEVLPRNMEHATDKAVFLAENIRNIVPEKLDGEDARIEFGAGIARLTEAHIRMVGDDNVTVFVPKDGRKKTIKSLGFRIGEGSFAKLSKYMRRVVNIGYTTIMDGTHMPEIYTDLSVDDYDGGGFVSPLLGKALGIEDGGGYITLLTTKGLFKGHVIVSTEYSGFSIHLPNDPKPVFALSKEDEFLGVFDGHPGDDPRLDMLSLVNGFPMYAPLLKNWLIKELDLAWDKLTAGIPEWWNIHALKSGLFIRKYAEQLARQLIDDNNIRIRAFGFIRRYIKAWKHQAEGYVSFDGTSLLLNPKDAKMVLAIDGGGDQDDLSIAGAFHCEETAEDWLAIHRQPFGPGECAFLRLSESAKKQVTLFNVKSFGNMRDMVTQSAPKQKDMTEPSVELSEDKFTNALFNVIKNGFTLGSSVNMSMVIMASVWTNKMLGTHWPVPENLPQFERLIDATVKDGLSTQPAKTWAKETRNYYKAHIVAVPRLFRNRVTDVPARKGDSHTVIDGVHEAMEKMVAEWLIKVESELVLTRVPRAEFFKGETAPSRLAQAYGSAMRIEGLNTTERLAEFRKMLTPMNVGDKEIRAEMFKSVFGRAGQSALVSSTTTQIGTLEKAAALVGEFDYEDGDGRIAVKVSMIRQNMAISCRHLFSPTYHPKLQNLGDNPAEFTSEQKEAVAVWFGQFCQWKDPFALGSKVKIENGFLLNDKGGNLGKIAVVPTSAGIYEIEFAMADGNDMCLVLRPVK